MKDTPSGSSQEPNGGHLAASALPADPSNGMIIAALEASLRFRDERGLNDVQPDSPGGIPAEMVRVVWRAMVERLTAEGYRIVPVEPTPAMFKAYGGALAAYIQATPNPETRFKRMPYGFFLRTRDKALARWRAMVEAA